MPTYEYVCDACGHEFEQLQRMSDPAVRKCPECRKLKVRRIISGGAGVIFKGSGFYETDYKRARTSGGKRPDEGGGSSESKAESKPSESKPAESKSPDSKPSGKSESGTKKDGGSSRD
jgi:putative FmdB family regulatory protein